MRRSGMISAAVATLAAMLLAPGAASAANSCVWTGSTSTDWATAANWSSCGGVIPTSADGVSIGTTSNSPIVSASGMTAASITLSGSASLQVSSGDLTVAGQITAPSGTQVTVTGGALSFATMQVATSTGLVASSGSISGTVSATAPVTLVSGATGYGAGLTLGANVTLQQTSDVTMSPGSSLSIGGDTYQLVGANLLGTGAQISVGPGGVLQKLGGTSNSTIQPQLDSQGTIEDSSAPGGSLTLAPALPDTLAGTLEADPSNGSGDVSLASGTYMIGNGGLSVLTPGNTGATVFGSGGSNIDLNGNTLTIGASHTGLELNGAGAHISGAGTIGGTGPVTLFGGTSLAPGSGNTMSVSAELMNPGGTMDLSGAGTVQVTGKWLTGDNVTDSGGATVDIGQSGVLQHFGGVTETFAPPVTDEGTIRQFIAASASFTIDTLAVTSTGTVESDNQGLSIGSLANLSGGTLSGGTYTASTGAGVGLPGPVTTLDAAVSLNGNGVLENVVGSDSALAGLSSIGAGGSLTLTGGETQSTALRDLSGSLTLGDTSSFTGGATTTVSPTGSISGTGTFDGNLVNGGTVAPGSPGAPGTLSVDGGYTQTSGGTLRAEVQGSGAGQLDVLSVTGNSTLGGRLAIVPSAGYSASAAAGDSLGVLTFSGSRIGGFASVLVAPLLSGKGVALTYDDAHHVVDAVVGTPAANTAAPLVSGRTVSGQTLSATTGAWTGATSFAYQWQQCDAGGASCTNIAGALSSSYPVRTSDVGHTLRVVVTGSNAYGAAAVSSAPTGPVTAAPNPKLTNAKLASHSFTASKGTTLSVHLSEPATVTLVITTKVTGRKVHGRCQANAKRGKRCSLTITRTLRFSGRAGSNQFRVRVSGLRPGRYGVTIIARDAGGRTSNRVLSSFTIKTR